MSVIAGALFVDRHAAEQDRRALAVRLHSPGSDVTAVARQNVAMACGASGTWLGESNIAHSPQAGLTITWDGRLDNRADLLCRLGRPTLDDCSDAGIALTVFERDGVAGLRSLVGDWAVAIWHAPARTLVLARDYMGVRPLYYCRDNAGVAWSSSLGELAIRTGRVDDLDERFIAGFVALRFSTDVTPYRGIAAVPPATCVRVSADGTESRERFWGLTPGTVRYRDPRDYDEQLLSLWRDAVGARLRSDGSVWAELSGGLDSSSIVCMADALIRERQVAATAVRPVSHVARHSPEGDESRFIAAVEERVGVSSDVLWVEEHQELAAPDSWVTPFAPRGIQVASERHVGQNGGRIILSGRLGDLVMGCSFDNSVAVFDDFADWKVGIALTKMRLWSRACRKPFAHIALGLARELGRTREAGDDRGRLDVQPAAVDLLAPALRSWVAEPSPTRTPGARRLRSQRDSVRPSKYALASAILGYSQDARLEARSSTPQVTYTYPFSHRPLVDFVLAIPGEELSAPGMTRSLMRRAFRGLVPDRVLRRQSKGYYPPAVLRALRLSFATLAPIEELEVVRRGWIDGERLAAATRVLTDGGGRIGGEVQRVLCLEEWLRSRNRRAPAAIPQGREVTTNAVLIA